MTHITLARDCAISTIALPHSGNKLLKTVAYPLRLRSIPRHGIFRRKKFVILIPHDELVVLVVPLRCSPLTLFTIYCITFVLQKQNMNSHLNVVARRTGSTAVGFVPRSPISRLKNKHHLFHLGCRNAGRHLVRANPSAEAAPTYATGFFPVHPF